MNRRVLLCVALSATLAACGGRRASESGDTRASGQQPSSTPASAGQYTEPRFPSYLRPPKTIDDVMPKARLIARNKIGFQGAGFGVVNSGETIAIVPGIKAEDMIVQATKRALEERGVKVLIVPEYEMAGVSEQDARELQRLRQSYTSEQGYMEVANWIENQFPDPVKAKAWLKQQRPDLYDTLYPKSGELNPHMDEVRKKMWGENVGTGIRTWLEKHPEVRGVFWGKGGATTLRRYLHPIEARFLGLFVTDNRWDVMSELGSYPGDVWLLAEQQSMEPLVYVDKLEISDPEGTHLTSEINELQAQRWARGVYQRGHLYLFPNQATGRFGYSVVNYPSFIEEYLPREPLALANGTIAGTINHTGFYPRWEVTVKDSRIVDVKGGGITGEALKTFLQYPHIADLPYPFHNPEHPGFFLLYEIASGTHPKAFRNPMGLDEGTAIPERQRAGVIHWGLGVTLHHDPGSPTKSQKLLDFTAKYNLPRDHGWHTHTYFNTYRLHLRNADKWVNVIDKGRLTSLDNTEVRALASRYGDPNQVLAYDWVPEIPGINAPGDYMKDYAPNPWGTVKRTMDEVKAGTYKHFFPAPGKTDQTRQTN
jgi:hypothetical protein